MEESISISNFKESKSINSKKIDKNIKMVSDFLKKISSLINHIDFLFKNKFIQKEIYIENMYLLNEIYNKIININKLKQKVIDNIFIDINNSLINICNNCGNNTISDVLNIFLIVDDFIKKKNDIYKNYFKILNEYFIPLSMIKIDKNVNINNFLKENNLNNNNDDNNDDNNNDNNQNNSIKIIKLLNITKNNTLIERINGASIIFLINNEMLLCINGYFKKDSLNMCKFIYNDFKNKLLSIKNELELIDIPFDFKETYLEQISLRDFILMNKDDIITMIKNDYLEFINYKNKSLSILIKEFIKSNIEKQRKIIILFLISDQDAQFTAHIIFDLISDKSYLLDSQYLSEVLFQSLHWKIQQIFKVSYDNFMSNKNKLDNISINDIPYDSRILSLKTTEHIKNKAMEKLKEINGSKDNSIKAQQWLDGLLKIPFNIYKKEPIINFFKDFQNNIDKYIDTFTLKIFEFKYEELNTINKNVYNIIIQIIDEYHSNIYKSEHSYMLFIKYINTVKDNILNEYNINKHIEKGEFIYKIENLLNTNEIIKISENISNIKIDDNKIDDNKEVIEKCMNELNNFKKIKSELFDSNNINKNNLGLMTNKLVEIENILQSNLFNNIENVHNNKLLKYSNYEINNDETNNETNNDETNNDETNNEYKKYIFKNLKIFEDLSREWDNFIIKKREYMNKVDKILDKCTYGQNDAKKQMKRIIGQWMNGSSKGQCFGLCGPPGVGKTTLCKNGLAKCLFDENGEERPFAFLPLGGSTNGSILEGHHYTYMGSTWGKIVDILMETKCLNPIIYIDELDKISKTEHGKEIVGILTHITDQSQNKEFYDKYFASIPFDLSQVLFIFSYNDRDGIDRILRDRIQEIDIKALNLKEKLVISQNYVIPEILSNVGFSTNEIIFNDNILNKIINEYTYECGVRKLNEILYDIVRDINLKKIMGIWDGGDFPINISIETMKTTTNDILENMSKITIKKIHKSSRIGLVNGLYATSGSALGGITIIQVMRIYSDKKFALEKLTGSQGNVMQESMNCAMTLAWNILPNEIKKDINESKEGYGLHIHCPESSTPKDGPSAGLAITLGIISRLIGIPIKNDVAMTGEVDLIGNALPIGGLHSKLMGALEADIKIVLVPYENRNDLELILKKESNENNSSILQEYGNKDNNENENQKIYFRGTMEIILVRNIFDILKNGLINNDIIFNTDF
jgi:ATP-dependent Lon protease